eukprot:gene14888-biopygen413
MPIPRKSASEWDRQLRFKLDSGREHPPRDMSSSQTEHCYSGIDDMKILAIGQRGSAVLLPTVKHQVRKGAPNIFNLWGGCPYNFIKLGGSPILEVAGVKPLIAFDF